ncbi:MAG: hypothetical protein ACOCXH_10710, partial [Cyclobacteriaceae bacterium]
MKPINLSEIQHLNNFQKENLISIYISTHRFGKEVNENVDATNLKSQLQKVKEILKNKGKHENEIDKLLKPAYNLIDDTGFWSHQLDGLAIFIDDNFFEYHQLPYEVETRTFVSDRFLLKPLLYSFSDNFIYYILTLSLDRIRLLEATEYGIYELDLEKILPEGVNEILNFYQFEQSLQMRSQQIGTTGEGKIFHGQGGGKSDNTPYIKEYFRKVNDELSRFFSSNKPSQMVLAGVEYLIPIFKEINSLANIANDFIHGNHDHTKPGELHEKANIIMKPYQLELQKKRMEKYNQLAGSGKTSYDLEEIVKAAVNGRV